jgi:anti-sigma regulatory factor (Ser/Thr protein kinase)
MLAARRLVTRELPSGDDQGGSLLLAHTAVSVQMARHRVREQLATAGVSQDLRDDVEIVIGELVGNCVRHAWPLPGGGLRVSWRRTGPLVDLQVTDGGSATAVTPREAEAIAVSGRGLTVVNALCRAWGVITLPAGERTVWADLVEPDGSAAWSPGRRP